MQDAQAVSDEADRELKQAQTEKDTLLAKTDELAKRAQAAGELTSQLQQEAGEVL